MTYLRRIVFATNAKMPATEDEFHALVQKMVPKSEWSEIGLVWHSNGEELYLKEGFLNVDNIGRDETFDEAKIRHKDSKTDFNQALEKAGFEPNAKFKLRRSGGDGDLTLNFILKPKIS